MREAIVKGFSRVFFEVQPRDADALGLAVMLDFHPAAGGQREFVLRDLVALRKVGIEIVFSSETGMLVHGAVQSQRGPDAHFDGALVEHRKSARKSQAHRANVGIGGIAESS